METLILLLMAFSHKKQSILSLALADLEVAYSFRNQ